MPKQRDASIMRFHSMGFSFTEIGQEVGVTKGVVAGVVKRHRDATEPSLPPLAYLEIYKMRIKGIEGKKIAGRFGITVSRATTIAHRYPKSIERDVRDLRICSLIDEGLSNPQIAAMTNVRPGTVGALRNELARL